jgi:sedoheptulose-bisphosphatase
VYTVTFDPIDGSAVMDSNFSVASVFAIWQPETPGASLDGLTGRALMGAALAIYGSRTTILLYNTQNKKVEELTLLKMGTKERWIVTSPDLKIAPDAKLFATALKSAYEIPSYLAVFEHYCKKGLSLRYSGAFAVDCYQLFIKGHGVYSMLESVAHPSRLQLIYEILPVAFLIEKAGGSTSDGSERSVLDIPVEGFKQRSAFIAGSANDVRFILTKVVEEESQEHQRIRAISTDLTPPRPAEGAKV